MRFIFRHLVYALEKRENEENVEKKRTEDSLMKTKKSEKLCIFRKKWAARRRRAEYP